MTSHTTKIWTAMMIFACIGRTAAITAFDCESSQTQVQAIDLLEPAACPYVRPAYEEPRGIPASIMRINTQRPVTAYSCKATVTRKAHKCGAFSIDFGYAVTDWETDHPVRISECWRAIQKGEVEMDGQTIKVSLNKLVTTEFFSHGYRNPTTGDCETTTFERRGVEFNGYERTYLKFLMREVAGIHDVVDQELQLDNHLRAPYEEGALKDALEGTIVWKTGQPSCDTMKNSLYFDRNVTVHQNITGSWPGSLVVIGGFKNVGLVVKQQMNVCDLYCYQTHIPQVAFCPLRPGETVPQESPFMSQTRDVEINILTQMAYNHLSTNLQFSDDLTNLQRDLCRIERKVLANKLQALANGNPYSLLDIFGPGHVVNAVGPTALVFKCQSVDVQLADYHNCTEEIPVKMPSGALGFVDGLTWVIKPYPTVLPCSLVTPVRWKLTGEWFCSTPQVIRCEDPDQLNVTTGNSFIPSRDFASGMGVGLFTESQLADSRKFRAAFLARKPITARIANAAVGYDDNSGNIGSTLGSPLDEYTDLPALGEAMIPLYSIFGPWTPTVILCLLMFFFGEGVLGFLIRIKVGCRVHGGPGWWILATVFSSTFDLIRMPADSIRKAGEILLSKDPEATAMQQGGGQHAKFSSIWRLKKTDEEKAPAVEPLRLEPLGPRQPFQPPSTVTAADYAALAAEVEALRRELPPTEAERARLHEQLVAALASLQRDDLNSSTPPPPRDPPP